jgi:molecular chaperone DnaK
VVAKKDFSSGFELINTVEKVFQKGSILPLKSKTEVYRTTRQLKKGQTENPLMIQAVEGESDIPDRNTFICELGIDGTDFVYDLPKDSELEITLDVDESRQLTVTAFIPLFDLSYDARSTIRDMIIEVNDLEMELITQKERAAELTKGCSPDEKRMINDVISSTESSVNNSRFDDDEKRKASKQLKDIKVSLDKLEKDKSFSQLSDTFYSEMQDANKFLDELTSDETKPQLSEMLNKIKEEGEKAIANNDKVMLTQINEVLHDFNMQILFNHPATWIYHFQQLSTEEHAFTNPNRAQYLINKGNLALENQDIKEIKECVLELFQLLPESEQGSTRNMIAGITR